MINDLAQLDQSIFLYLNNLGNTNWDWFWLFITDKWSWIPLYGLMICLLHKKVGLKSTMLTLLFVTALIFFTDQFSNLLKGGTQRLRPCNLAIDGRFIARCGLHGFPSAHAFSSMALALFLGSILKPYYKYALKALITWALLLGYSRIYVGVHYPGDVFAGLVFGMITGGAFIKIYRWITQKHFSPQANQSLILSKNNDSIRKIRILKYQNLLPYLFFVIAISLYFRTEFHPHIFILEDTAYEVYYEMLAVFISILGLSIRVLTRGYSQKPSLKNITKKQNSPVLNTCGVYSLLRHPLYLANFLIGLGVVLWTGNYWFITTFSILYWVYYDHVILIKEKSLKDQYGSQYEKWAQEVPAFLICFKNFKKPTRTFRWKRILYTEKKWLFFTFLIYCFLNVSGEFMTQGTNYNYFLIGFTSLSGLGVLILYYLKNKTTFLRERSVYKQ